MLGDVGTWTVGFVVQVGVMLVVPPVLPVLVGALSVVLSMLLVSLLPPVLHVSAATLALAGLRYGRNLRWLAIGLLREMIWFAFSLPLPSLPPLPLSQLSFTLLCRPPFLLSRLSCILPPALSLLPLGFSLPLRLTFLPFPSFPVV